MGKEEIRTPADHCFTCGKSRSEHECMPGSCRDPEQLKIKKFWQGHPASNVGRREILYEVVVNGEKTKTELICQDVYEVILPDGEVVSLIEGIESFVDITKWPDGRYYWCLVLEVINGNTNYDDIYESASYASYARVNGRTPTEQREQDKKDYLGGRPNGFILWNKERLLEYKKINPSAFYFGNSVNHGNLVDHEAYDKWLDQYPVKDAD